MKYVHIFYSEGFVNHQETAEFFKTLVDLYGSQIENMPFVRMIIDKMYVLSKKVIGRIGLFYTFTFCIPFMLQIISYDYTLAWYLNQLCLFGITVFFLLRLVILVAQYSISGMVTSNEVFYDTLQVVMYYVYYFKRITAEDH